MRASRGRSGLLRRLTQALFLSLFCLPLLPGLPLPEAFPADLFLRLDPLAGMAVPLLAKAVVPALWPAFVLLALTLLAGRLFCGWVCPLGTTLDLAGALLRALFGRSRERRARPGPRRFRFLLLAFVLAAAFAGLSLLAWVSPLSLAARLWGLLLAPLGLSAAGVSLAQIQPLLEGSAAAGLLSALPEPPIHAACLGTGFAGLALIALEFRRPRFWCRHLCPAGALLGLCSRFSLLRRRAGPACTGCGACARVCPAGLLSGDPGAERPADCLLCGRCQSVCPAKAVSFLPGREEKKAPAPDLPGRRALCAALACGAGLACLGTLPGTGSEAAGLPVRPPGSRPEPDFLARCLRCGACVAACPAHALRPLELTDLADPRLSSGPEALLTPVLSPRSGGCRPDCAACLAVCPTGALLKLPLREKQSARVGTAKISEETCLAWHEDRRCMVCKENCPWGAVEVVIRADHRVPVPVTDPARCFGCGFCENQCPRKPPAIIVLSEGALRLGEPRFAEEAKARGLRLSPVGSRPGSFPAGPEQRGTESDQAPPGFLSP